MPCTPRHLHTRLLPKSKRVQMKSGDGVVVQSFQRQARSGQNVPHTTAQLLFQTGKRLNAAWTALTKRGSLMSLAI